MLKNDLWITEQAGQGMLEPFQSSLIRHLDPERRDNPVLSFGCSSYGYDLRLSPQEFLIFRHVPGTVMNPKRFNPANLEPTPLHEDEDGEAGVGTSERSGCRTADVITVASTSSVGGSGREGERCEFGS